MTKGQQHDFADEVVTQECTILPVIGRQAAIDGLVKFREQLGMIGFVSWKIGGTAVEGSVRFDDAMLTVKLRTGNTVSLGQVVRTEW